MKMYFTLSLAALLALAANTLEASQSPKGLFTDNRIKIVNYDENNVVHVNTTFGFATTIELQKGEYVVDKTGLGKKEGWEITSSAYSNLIILKPLMENNTTNLNFTTNRGRTYTLFLTANQQASKATFRMRFIYSDTKGLSTPEQAYNLIQNFGNPNEVNSNYSFWGDKTIAPILAKDNGTFTLLRFKKGAPIPAILAVDLKTKRESLVNYRLQGGYVVIEGVYPQYSFRLGDHVTCLFNDAAIKLWKLSR